MNKPYMGKILMVDLSDHTITPEAIPDRVYEEYLSGMGLGAYILYHRIPQAPTRSDRTISWVSVRDFSRERAACFPAGGRLWESRR